MKNIASIGREVGHHLAEILLVEEENEQKMVGIFAGRFQPFHRGHYDAYADLVKKFGKKDVYIATSDAQDPVRSPFSFEEKQKLISTMFGIPTENIVKTKNPFKPVEILDKYDPKSTSYVTTFSEKDAGRLGKSGAYFKKLPSSDNRKNLQGYRDGGYYYVMPVTMLDVGGHNVSGTQIRNLFGDPSLSTAQKKVLMKKIYGKVDDSILKLVVAKTTAAETAKKSAPAKKTRKKKATNRDAKIENPKTGRKILARSALAYGSSHPAYASARKALQMEAFLFEGVNDPGILKAVILAGGPGSGKTYTGGKLFDIPEGSTFGASGLKVINSDVYFEYLLKKNGLTLDIDSMDAETAMKATDPDDPNSIRNQAKRLHKKVYKHYQDERLGMLIDQTGHKTDKIARQKAELEALGYDVHLIFVSTPLDVAQERNKMRERILKPELLEKVWRDSMKNLEEFKKIMGDDKVTVVDNSVYGQPFSKKIVSIARKMVVPPIENPRGRRWIAQQKEKIRRPPLEKQPDERPAAGSRTAAQQKGAEDPKSQRQARDPEAPVGQKGVEDPKGRRQKAAEDPSKKRKASVLDKKIRNPETGKQIYVRTALKYHKSHPAKRAAQQLMQAHYVPTNAHRTEMEINEVMISRALFLSEGGAAGHMAHPFEDMHLTFGDLKRIVEMGLEGELHVEAPVLEKMDGQNIMVSYRPDRGVIFARNKGQVKNRGAEGMSVSGIKQLFAGRGQIAAAFGLAADDLQSAIGKLGAKQKKLIFKDGASFMSVEIIYPPTQNVIPYGQNMLIFHDTIEHDMSGNPIGGGGGHGRVLAGMVKQINQHIQNTFKFHGPMVVKLPKSQNFGARKGHYLSRITKLQSQYGLTDSDEVLLWHQRWWENFIMARASKLKYSIPGNILNALVLRWGFFNKSALTIPQMRKQIQHEKFVKWAIDYDKSGKTQQFKSNIAPFEMIFLQLGAEILQNVVGLVSVNPDKSVQQLSSDLTKTVKALRQAKDAKKLSDLRIQLAKLNAIGVGKIAPTEGIVFMYKNKIYKLTGTFAPMNQILGMLRF